MKRFKMNKILQILFILLFGFGIFCIYLGCNNVRTIYFSYKEESNIKYNVYYKPNQFFDTPYLEENQTYIASLIDYIDVQFDYSSYFNKDLVGEVKYKYTILVSADKKDSNGHYWQKEFDLSEYKYAKLDNNSQINISDNFQVKYETYNNLINKFKKEYSLSTDGVAKIMMKLENNSHIEGVDEPINITSSSSLSIPLLEKSLEISMNKDIANTDKTIAIKQVDNSIKYIILKVIGVLYMVVSVIGFIKVTIDRKKFKDNNEYDLALKKILDSYDSIIITIQNVPSLDESKRITLNSFEELLDVYNEVRMPINYYQNPKDDKSTFLIINDDVAWIYTLKRSNE